MSHRSHSQNLSEWAELIGASLPDSVEDLEDASAGSEAYGVEALDALGSEFGADPERNR
ncbi:hypothetical protein [Halobellus inordinatus]|uniref:hypothetical protein n=1 Tax=Halobellus inordinatus TaxID=1126236 RepID=UPI002108FC6B|nr:hypothetical protein [Halobellus inordinatus]